MLFIILGALILLLQGINANPILVIDFIRHGARSPGSPDSFFPNITWPIYGQLGPVGQRQQYLLGRLRRQQYIDEAKLLPEIFTSELIYARASYFARTIMSVQSYLLGLYPYGLSTLNKNQTAHASDLLTPPIDLTVGKELIKELDDKPVPNSIPAFLIRSSSEATEDLLLVGNCPYFHKTSANFFNSDSYKQVFNNFTDTWKELIKVYPQITMSALEKDNRAFTLSDFFQCAEADGRKPYKLTPQIMKKFKEFLGLTLSTMTSQTPLQRKLGVYNLVQEIVGLMNKTIAGTTRLKYAVYSGHDTTIIPLLNGLHDLNNTIELKQTPEYAGNLLFELHDAPDNKIVIYYDGQVIHSENYATFVGKFMEVINLGKSYEDACKS